MTLLEATLASLITKRQQHLVLVRSGLVQACNAMAEVDTLTKQIEELQQIVTTTIQPQAA
jgi:archaellum component FlaC